MPRSALTTSVATRVFSSRIQFLSAAMRSRVLALADVPVVEQHQRRVVDIAHVVLVREPRGWVRGIDPEIAALPQPPDDVAVARPVGVIDLDHPVLGAQGHDQVPVRRRPGDGVRVRPVARALAQRGEAVDVQPVEGVPDPRHLEVLVQDEDHVAVVQGGFALEVDGPRSRGQDRRVPVGQALGVVVEVRDRVLPQRGQLGVDGVDVRLAQGVAGQVDLPERVRSPVRVLRAAQQEDRAARHEARGKAGERVGHRVVIPHDVAHQVRRQGIDGAGRAADSRRGKRCPESGQFRGQAPAVP